VIVVFSVIWVALAIVDAGAAFLIAYDFFQARSKIGPYWIAALAAIAFNSLAEVAALLLVRKGASHTSQIIGLWIMFIFQVFKTATIGALALHMRGNLGNPKPKPAEEQNQ